MTHLQVAATARGGRMVDQPAKPPHLGRFFSVLKAPQTGRNLAYLLLAFPLGIAYFVALVTALSTGAGLLVTVAGAPLLIVSVYIWCFMGDVDAVLTNQLLGTHIASRRFGPEPGRLLSWTRIKARLGNITTWRTLAFLFLRFPLGIVAFVATVTALSVSAALIAAPVLAYLGAGPSFGYWDVDTWWEGLLLAPLGMLLLPASLHGLNLGARGCGKLAELFLGKADEDGLSVPDTVAAAAVQWQGLSLSRPATAAAARVQQVQVRLFLLTLALCAAVCGPFLLINALTTPGEWWVLWAVWGAAILMLLHGGYLVRGIFGAHAGLFLGVNGGLFGIDMEYGRTTWFYWPLLGWALVLGVHLFADLRFRRGLSLLPSLLPDGSGVESEPEHFVAAELPPAVSVDVAMRIVKVHGQPVDLTPKEFDLLTLFVQNPGRPFSRDELLDRIWKSDYEVTDRTVDTHVLRLRKKLGQRAEVIQTVWGVGYKYEG